MREARQNLSVYLQRVQAGETFTVTDHGRPVALLGPVPASDDPLADLVARAQADPPKPWRPLPEPVVLSPGPSVSEILHELREDRVF